MENLEWTEVDLHIETSLNQFLIVASVDNKLRRIKSDAAIITVIVVANIPTCQPFCI